jgi:serine/threonine protein kinase/lipopolysaccharide biosynthesis regulator YciM
VAQVVCRKCRTSYATRETGGSTACPSCGALNPTPSSSPKQPQEKKLPAPAPRGSVPGQAFQTGDTMPFGKTPYATSLSQPDCPDEDDRPTAVIQTAPGAAPPAVRPVEQTAAAAEQRAPAGKRELGPYQILEEIGRGGMGLVLRARDEELRREVAVKVLRSDVRQDERRRLRFIEEAQITGQLEHPGIAPVHLLGRDEKGTEFFSMKLVSGQTLDKLLAQWHAGKTDVRDEYPLARLLAIFERVCETVSFAHSRGVIHRDLKPGNVMIGTHGEVWVLDWGLARVLGETRPEEKAPDAAPVESVRRDYGANLTLDGLTVGTPEYMSPEQARGEELDERADLFGLGAVLYEILTGLPPVQGKTLQAVVTNAALGRFSPVRRTGAGRHAPPALAAIAEKCLAAQPKKRYASTRELLRDLRAFAADEAVSAQPDTHWERLARFGRRHRSGVALAGAVTGLFLLLITVGSLLLAAKDRQARKADAQRLQAELEQQKTLAASAEMARRRLEAFGPYAQAMDLLMRGQLPDQTVGLLQQALKTDADFPEAQFALGEALRLSGQPAPAAEAYLKADELSRRLGGRPNLQAVVAAGFAYDGAGDYAKAEDAFRRAESHEPAEPLALVGKTFRLSHHRKLREALASAEEALRRGPHLWETHFGQGYVLLEATEEGLLDPREAGPRAIAALRQALELSPRQAEACIWLSIGLRRLGLAEQKEWLGLVDRTIALEPRNGARYFHRGTLRLNLGDPTGAEKDMAEAQRLGISPALLQVYQAQVAARKNNTEEAFSLMEKVVKETRDWPPHVANWLNLGFSIGKDQEIRSVYERWCQENPEYSQVFMLRASLLFRDGRTEDGLAEVRRGLRILPYNVRLGRLLANQLAQHGQADAALKEADRLLEFAGTDYTCGHLRLHCLVRLGRLDDALDYVATLEKKFPERSEELGKLRVQIEALRKR